MKDNGILHFVENISKNIDKHISKKFTVRYRQKLGTEVTLNLSSNLIGVSDVETNFPHNSLLTDRQFLRFRKVFPNNLSAPIKLSKI